MVYIGSKNWLNDPTRLKLLIKFALKRNVSIAFVDCVAKTKCINCVVLTVLYCDVFLSIVGNS